MKNGEDGFRIEAGNSGNLVLKNNLKANGTIGPVSHDCYDVTGGANTWTKGTGKTQNVPGLCKDAKVT